MKFELHGTLKQLMLDYWKAYKEWRDDVMVAVKDLDQRISGVRLSGHPLMGNQVREVICKEDLGPAWRTKDNEHWVPNKRLKAGKTAAEIIEGLPKEPTMETFLAAVGRKGICLRQGNRVGVPGTKLSKDKTRVFVDWPDWDEIEHTEMVEVLTSDYKAA